MDILLNMACKRANTVGGRKYTGKDFGGGIVFQSYSEDDLMDSIILAFKKMPATLGKFKIEE